MGTFGLHGLILCDSEDVLSELLCIHNVGMGTFGLHELILCVSEGLCFVFTLWAWKLLAFMD